ncbi:MAG: hypothetical protein LBJ23_05380 [Tannerella sp.]|nr:hypothetical protein [Tannerella sp.]
MKKKKSERKSGLLHPSGCNDGANGASTIYACLKRPFAGGRKKADAGSREPAIAGD